MHCLVPWIGVLREASPPSVHGLLTETGLAGFAFYLLAAAGALRGAWRARRDPAGLALGLAVGGYLLWEVTQYPVWRRKSGAPSVSLAGLCRPCPARAVDPAANPPRPDGKARVLVAPEPVMLRDMPEIETAHTSWMERFDRPVRCRSGHLFTTIWIPGGSLKGIRLGGWRFQHCPVGHHWTAVVRLDPASTAPADLERAAAVHDLRVP